MKKCHFLTAIVTLSLVLTACGGGTASGSTASGSSSASQSGTDSTGSLSTDASGADTSSAADASGKRTASDKGDSSDTGIGYATSDVTLGTDDISGEEPEEEGGEILPDNAYDPSGLDSLDTSLPYYLAGDYSGEEITDISAGNEYASEGANGVPGEEVTLADDAVFASVGEEQTVTTEYGTYKLTVDSIALTDARSEEDTAAVENVVLVTFTYTNVSYEDSLYIDSFAFRLLDSENVQCAEYWLEDNFSEPIAVGESQEGTAAFELDETGSVTLVYDDMTAADADTQICWETSV